MPTSISRHAIRKAFRFWKLFTSEKKIRLSGKTILCLKYVPPVSLHPTRTRLCCFPLGARRQAWPGGISVAPSRDPSFQAIPSTEGSIYPRASCPGPQSSCVGSGQTLPRLTLVTGSIVFIFKPGTQAKGLTPKDRAGTPSFLAAEKAPDLAPHLHGGGGRKEPAGSQVPSGQGAASVRPQQGGPGLWRQQY